MARLLLTVEGTFRVKEGGLALTPPLVIQSGEGFHAGDPITLKRPDGSTVEWQIEGLTPIPPRRSPREIGLVLKGLKKRDIPVGTEVWSAGSQIQEPLPQAVPLPKWVIVRVDDPRAEGLVMRLRFGMSMKNDYYYMFVLGDEGVVQISRDELLRDFDQDAAGSPMDYVDPRGSFTGKITAEIYSTSELRNSLKSMKQYREFFSYPEGLEEKLRRAAKRGQKPEEYQVELEVEN